MTSATNFDQRQAPRVTPLEDRTYTHAQVVAMFRGLDQNLQFRVERARDNNLVGIADGLVIASLYVGNLLIRLEAEQ